MEVINMEAQTFEAMMSRFEAFTEKVDRLCGAGDDKTMEKWLDNQDVCQILNISRRTLQDYRTTGKIAYIQLGGKTLYRESDIQKMLDEHYRSTFE